MDKYIQNIIASSEKLKDERSFWINTFSKDTVMGAFPKDYKGYDNKVCIKNTINIEFSDEVGEKLILFSNNSDKGIYMILLTGILYLIHRYSGYEDVIVGMPVFKEYLKNNPSNKTLAIRSQYNMKRTFKEYVLQIHSMVNGAIENQKFPLSKINEILKITKDSDDIVYNIIVQLESIHDNICFEDSGVDVQFSFFCKNKKVGGKLLYNSNLYSNEMMQHIVNNLYSYFEIVTKNANSLISEIEILSQIEKNKILYEFNNTKTEYLKNSTINQLFEEQVRRTPENTAVVFAENSLSYIELNKRANALARTLRKKGIKRDYIVGIMVERSLNMVIGILGILKAGGAYLPIDPNLPKERIKYILKDSKSKIVLSTEKLIKHAEIDIQFIDLSSDKWFDNNWNNLQNVNNCSSLAYVIYTSGTTGVPKGVMVEHRNLSNLVSALNKSIYHKYNKFLKVGLVSPYYFDASVKGIFSAILNGHCLYIVDDDTRKDGDSLLQYYEKNKIEITDGTPMHIKMLINSSRFKKNKLVIKHYIIGGEALTLRTVRKFYKYIKKDNIVYISNVYGPTECCVDASSYLVDSEKIKNSVMKSVPIGKPIANYKMYIVDKYNKEMPIGIPGELCISGDGLARGYLNNPQLTREKFVDNPFEVGSKMYKTGDLARWLPDGNIEYLGRIDSQVKIRGFRIELEEIENRLLQHEDINEAVVIAKEDDKNNEKYICVYIISEKNIRDLNLREYLKENLPEYMIPTHFANIEKIPLTPNGKLDREVLLKLKFDDNLIGYEEPKSEIEKKLVGLWEDILKSKNIGINDNFFTLGGHSLKAMVLMSKIHKELNKEIPLKQLFKSPTIKGLSKYIESIQESACLKIEKTEEKEYYEASSAQKRMYMLQQLYKNSTSYNISGLFEIVETKFDKNRLEEVFEKLIQRHEALRTYFEIVNGNIVQKIDNSYKFKLKERKYNKKIMDVVNELIRPFDLEKAPLFRVELVKNQDKTYLLIDMHHIISDGVSMSILINEFVTLYNGGDLEPLKLQYKDFAVWQNKLLKSEKMKNQEKYWISMFKDEIPILNMPTDYKRPLVQSFDGNSVSFQLDEGLTEELRKLSKKTETTMHMILLSIFTILLSKYSGQEDIIIGIPTAGRVHSDLENIVGVFVNTLALRNKPEENKRYIDFLNEVKENSLKAYENQSYQLETLIEKLNIDRDTSRNPLFDVMFNMVNIDTQKESKNSILKTCDSEGSISKFDLTLDVIEEELTLKFRMEYCLKLFNKETIMQMCNHYTSILKNIIKDDKVIIGEINLLMEEEKKEILYGFNRTEENYPKEKTIQELFEDQVKKAPNNTAVVFNSEYLTYKELNKKANSLAVKLRNKGVVSDTVIGIKIEKSLEMIIGIMGILKSGAAYLPIAYDYPKERIEYMLRDSEVKILLTTEDLIYGNNVDIEVINLSDKKVFSGDLNNLEVINNPENLAYILYTSGSTGKPKGVMIQNRGVVNLVDWFGKQYGINENYRILQTTNYTFDVSVEEIFGALLNGASLYLADIKSLVSKNFKEYIDENSINIAQFVPSTLEMFVANTDKINSLNTLICGGEKLNNTLKNKILSKGYNLFNHYGPTEITVDAITTKCCNKSTNIIGKPIQNTKIYILNNKNQLVPKGVVGEICISGDGLARGYLNNSELTLEKFVDNPFEKGTKIYKTGDFGKLLMDGNIEFLGRIDDQVKLRGVRIELGDIENKLLQYSNIKEAVVLLRENKSLCAYIVSKYKVNFIELKSYLKDSLPQYMIPDYYVQLDELPLTLNGKVDKGILLKFKIDKNLRQYEAPTNNIEETLERIWSEVLAVDKVGINDNFFELGGHSLKAMTLVSKIYKETNKEVPLKELFKLPTIKELSKFIGNVEENNIYSSIEKIEEKEYYETSSAQKRMYVIQSFDKKSTAYNIPQIFELQGYIDKEKIEATFKQLVK
ncbi:amino acid adenylation domain-containing protein, partial [Clostridium felsineum]|uniref:non-ribosomal peptide synthetase n=1 Tax=Clostridium felsineum TaxID=36839 RepID=UPI00214D8A9E